MSSDTGERRLAPVFLFLSALAFGGIAIQEGYSDKAIIPVKGDKPTIGFGTTTRPDGSPVKPGDAITPPQAVQRALVDVQRFEGALKRCIKAPLAQREYDAFVSLAYNVGDAAFCGSTLVKKVNALDYAGACDEILRWRFFQGRDCSLAGSGCAGLWTRRQAERNACAGVTQ